MCEVGAIIRKNEQYAMGWIRLHESDAPVRDMVEMAQYKMDLTRLFRKHLDRCPPCLRDYELRYPDTLAKGATRE